jgi:hypothetical protein
MQYYISRCDTIAKDSKRVWIHYADMQGVRRQSRLKVHYCEALSLALRGVRLLPFTHYLDFQHHGDQDSRSAHR